MVTVEVGQLHQTYNMLHLILYVTLWLWRLMLLLLAAVVYQVWCDQTLYQIFATSSYTRLSY